MLPQTVFCLANPWGTACIPIPTSSPPCTSYHSSLSNTFAEVCEGCAGKKQHHHCTHWHQIQQVLPTTVTQGIQELFPTRASTPSLVDNDCLWPVDHNHFSTSLTLIPPLTKLSDDDTWNLDYWMEYKPTSWAENLEPEESFEVHWSDIRHAGLHIQQPISSTNLFSWTKSRDWTYRLLSPGSLTRTSPH